MIRIQAAGGLGNQLFIWNLAHHLEDKFKCRIVIHFPASKSDRKCEIQALRMFCEHRIEVVESDTFNRFVSLVDRLRVKNSVLAKIIDSSLRIYQTKLPAETFELVGKKPRIVRGYFQSPDLVSKNIHLYFTELNNLTTHLRQESPLNQEISDSASIFHIRRGDFLSNKEKVGLLKYEYFENQIRPDEKTVIFTDASEGDSEISTYFEGVEIYGDEIADTWTSFAFMSFARKLVTSNSTFSWWAGFLAQARGGEVVAPSPWTRTTIYGPNYLSFEGFTYTPALFYEDKK
jgi:hypothetical protein